MLKKSRVEEIKKNTESLTQVFYSISEKLYQQNPGAANAAAGDATQNENKDDNNNNGTTDAKSSEK